MNRNQSPFTWPLYNSNTSQNVVLDLTLTQESNYKKLQCDFWNQILFN